MPYVQLIFERKRQFKDKQMQSLAESLPLIVSKALSGKTDEETIKQVKVCVTIPDISVNTVPVVIFIAIPKNKDRDDHVLGKFVQDVACELASVRKELFPELKETDFFIEASLLSSEFTYTDN